MRSSFVCMLATLASTALPLWALPLSADSLTHVDIHARGFSSGQILDGTARFVPRAAAGSRTKRQLKGTARASTSRIQPGAGAPKPIILETPLVGDLPHTSLPIEVGTPVSKLKTHVVRKTGTGNYEFYNAAEIQDFLEGTGKGFVADGRLTGAGVAALNAKIRAGTFEMIGRFHVG